MQKAVTAVLFLVLLALPALAGGGLKRVTKHHVSIELPDGWVVFDDPRPETIVSIHKTPEEEGAKVAAVIEVGILPMPAEVRKESLENIGRLLAEASMNGQQNVVVEMPFQSTHIAKRPAVEWAYRFTAEVDGEPIVQRMHVAMLRKGSDSYLIAYHGPHAGPDESADLANDVMHSVLFEK